MGIKIQIATAIAALCLAGCASSSVKKTWKSPDYRGGVVQKIAVVGVEERGVLRKGFENRFVRDFREHSQEAIVTHELLTLQEMKADKQAAAARLRSAGADSVLIVRLVDQVTYDSQVRANPAQFVGTVSGINSSYGWYDYYSLAFIEMGTVWSSSTTKVYIDASLYDLTTGQRLWSGLTKSTLKETTDRVEEVDALVAKLVTAMRKDGMVR